MTKLVRSVWFAWRTVWEAWPAGAAAYPVLVVSIALAAGPVSAYGLGRIVDVSPIPWVLAPLGATLLRVASRLVYGPLQTTASMYTRHRLRGRLLAAAAGTPGLEHLENPRHADSMHLVRTRAWATTVVFSNLPELVSALLSAVVAVALLGSVHVVLVACVLVSALGGALQARAAVMQLDLLDRSSRPQRLAARLATIAMSLEAAKEVRMLGLGDFLVDEHRRLTDGFIADLSRTHLRRMFALGGAGLLRGAALGAGVLVLVVLGSAGDATPGQVAMGMTLLLSGVQSIGGIGEQVSRVAEWARFSEHLEWLLGYRSPVTVPADPIDTPDRLATGIELRDVTFAYPGTDRIVLDGVSLRLPAGGVVAFVGDNGAGKTTLVKLLCRFYDPDAGAILVDGIDLREVDPVAWRARVTAAFQDFLNLLVVARESIGVGDLASVGDDDAVLEAAALGGAADVVESLPQGLQTQLGREFPGGVDLSVGQWQRVALSRASMRRSALLVLLDEPTASLDARAEHEVFERLAGLSAAHRESGAITLLVSHRFSTVRMADHIVVMHEGRVVEQGSHEELMALAGTYAELYTLQADSYR